MENSKLEIEVDSSIKYLEAVIGLLVTPNCIPSLIMEARTSWKMRKYERLHDYDKIAFITGTVGIIAQGTLHYLFARKGYPLWVVPATTNVLSGFYEYLMSDRMANKPWLSHIERKKY